jgi:predicted DNA-binding transcriptional regulator AlpA
MNLKAKSEQRHSPAATAAPDSPNTEASSTLLTPAELAKRLSVPVSWVREKSRQRARLRDKDPLPLKKLGKYVRFSLPEVNAWVSRQGN